MSDTLTNSMNSVVTVLPPPLRHVALPPIKDAMVASTKPFVNFGKGVELITSNVSGSEKYKSILTFKVPLS